MHDDFATTPAEVSVSFWDTDLGRAVTKVASSLDQGLLPEVGIDALRDCLGSVHGSGIENLSDFNASQQAIQLANLLNKSIKHYMPGGFIDDSKASASDIKNLLSTASSVIKLISQTQNDLYTADRMAAMEKAVFNTFDTMAQEVPGIDAASAKQLRQLFRDNLEKAFTGL